MSSPTEPTTTTPSGEAIVTEDNTNNRLSACIPISTLAMTFENPSSTSLTLPADLATPHHHPHLHTTRPRSSRAPSIISEKQELDDSRSNATRSNATHVGDDYDEYDRKFVKNDNSGITHKTEEQLEDGVLDNSDNVSIIDGRIVSYPEGGFGWLVVLASFVVNFWAFAPNITFGVYQAYFLQSGTFPGALPTDISWVGSIGTAAMFIPGPFVAPLTRLLGLKAVVAIGIALASLGLILASFFTQLWHLYLTQGFLFGVGGGLVFFSSISVTAQYFEKRRGLANGIAVAGSGIGGLAISPLTRYLIAQVGIRWCQRIMGFAVLGFMSAVFAFIRPRVQVVKKGPVFDMSIIRVPGFMYLMATAFIVTFGYMVPVFLIPTYSNVELGQTASTSANLISIFSGINAASRIILGVAADKLGRTNTLFTCCFLAGASCLAIWSVASNIEILTGFMVVYGLFGGGFISIFPVVVAQVVGIERLSAALGILYFGNVVGNLLGAPIATAIMHAQGGKYIGAIIFAGLSPVVAAFFVLVIRFRINKKIFAIA
ncbi:hypothetical protein BGZ96_010936 [Linnemannia gamsii]|uniref:Major facilitator superfamily (MFS) profile domain-containing protein n=1 Tax=Linnemannia gamsii TaxID=64522 RepID=A0ABQ7KCK0_9FUNG|nr:hypothetical protein BGZ96_010936 [Linnemannia gamsii]